MFQQLQYIMGFIYSFSMKKLEDESKAMFSSNMQSKEYSQSLSCFLQSAQLHSKLFPLMSQTFSGKHDRTVVFILMGLKKVKYALVMFCQIIRCSMLMYYRWLHGISATTVFSVLLLFTVSILLHQIVIWYVENMIYTCISWACAATLQGFRAQSLVH